MFSRSFRVRTTERISQAARKVYHALIQHSMPKENKEKQAKRPQHSQRNESSHQEQDHLTQTTELEGRSKYLATDWSGSSL